MVWLETIYFIAIDHTNGFDGLIEKITGGII